MKKYNFITKFFNSIVPSDMYLTIHKEKFIYSILYVIVLLMITSTISGFYLGSRIKDALNSTIEDYSNGIIKPITFSEKDGMVYESDKYTIVDHFDVPVVIDDKNTAPINTLYDLGNYVILGKNNVEVYFNNTKIAAYKYDDVATFSMYDFSSEEIKEMLKITSLFVIPLQILSRNFTSAISFLFDSIFLFLAINIVSMFKGIRIKTLKLYQTILYAMTVPVMWKMFISFFQSPMPGILNNFVLYGYPILIMIVIFNRIKAIAIKNNKQ